MRKVVWFDHVAQRDTQGITVLESALKDHRRRGGQRNKMAGISVHRLPVHLPIH